jgi:hypothetical protein
MASLFKENNKTFVDIGHLHLAGDTMRFHRKNGFTNKDIKALGDVTYFMFVNKKLMKIGKCEARGGFITRLNQYGQGRYADATNRLIMDVMDDIPASDIVIKAISIPRSTKTRIDYLTGEKFTILQPCAREYEAGWTKMYLDENVNNELPFCRQVT